MVLHRPGEPLVLEDRAPPAPGPEEVRLRVEACGVCRTDLHVVDGELPDPRLPLVLGHQVVGRVEVAGSLVRTPARGQRAGIPWLAWTCRACRYCLSGRENLCPSARFTGYHVDGGYATTALADHRYVLALPEGVDSAHLAPLLCAGLIGYRALRMAGEPERLGLYGFGSSAHIVAQVARHEGRRVYAFTRPGDAATQRFALELGAEWAGDSTRPPPDKLDAAIIFATAGELVPAALAATAPGGVVVCAGIHMSDIPSFPYSLLWGERVVRSVANLTRRDGEEFMTIASQAPVTTSVETLPLEEANRALAGLRAGHVTGSLVVVP